MYLTADLCDEFSSQIRIAEPIFKAYGALPGFAGEIHTVKVHEDNVLVKAELEKTVDGGVLVVDGGASLRCALVGDNLANMAVENGWAGIIVYGCIRDSAEISGINIGIKALNTHPLKSVKKGRGDVDVPVTFAGVTFFPGQYVYADSDGVIVAKQRLK